MIFQVGKKIWHNIIQDIWLIVLSLYLFVFLYQRLQVIFQAETLETFHSSKTQYPEKNHSTLDLSDCPPQRCLTNCVDSGCTLLHYCSGNHCKHCQGIEKRTWLAKGNFDYFTNGKRKQGCKELAALTKGYNKELNKKYNPINNPIKSEKEADLLVPRKRKPSKIIKTCWRIRGPSLS